MRSVGTRCIRFMILVIASAGLCHMAAAKILYAQAASDSSTGNGADASDSESGFQIADDITLTTAATIRSVQWWGGYGPFSNTPLAPLTFQLIFYGDSGGLPDPGNILSSTTVQFDTPVPAGESISATTIYEFRADVAPTPIPANTRVWFSVWANTSNDPDDTFLWRVDNLGNCAQRSNSTGGLFIALPGLRPLFALHNTPVRAITTIFADDFSGVAGLNGSMPDIRPAAETWTASTDWQANGTTASVASTSEDDSAFLPFTPLPGKIYTLSATLQQPTGGNSTAAWAGIGFAAGNNTGGFATGANNPSPWMYFPRSALIRTVNGPGNTGIVIEATYSGPRTLKIVLDTTSPNWQAEWFVGIRSLRKHTFASNPAINQIGIAREDGAAVDFDSFSLTVEDGDVAPRILSFTSAGGGVWELFVQSNPGMPHEFRSSTDLVFNPGVLVENLAKGDPGDPGTIGGPNQSVVTTDANGVARLRMVLTGNPRNFVRAVSLP